MHRLRFLWTLSILVVLVMSVSPALAQSRTDRDGDGVPNDLDRCPDDPGPPENRGCPVGVNPGGDGGPAVWDGDGDGLTDDIDFCPHGPGPAENGGCPLPEPTDEPAPARPLPPLPEILADGPCMVATQSHTGVNIRLWPTMNAQIVDGMSAYELYPIAYRYTNAEGQLWYAIPGGFVASWVTRVGGQCEGLAAFDVSLSEEGETATVLNTSILVPLDFTPDVSPPDEPALTFSPDRFPFPEMPPDPLDQVLLAQFGPDADQPAMISTGLLLPAIQHRQQAASESGQMQHLVLMVPGSMFEFTPLPDPSGLDTLSDTEWSWAEFSPLGWAWGEWSWAGLRPLAWAWGGWSWAEFSPLAKGFDEYLVFPEDWLKYISLETSDQSTRSGDPALLITMMIGPGTEEATVPVELVALGVPGDTPKACDSSVRPTTEMACLYTAETGDSALCIGAVDDWATCIYGVPALPAVQ